jgi:cardiolipin synthase A/B
MPIVEKPPMPETTPAPIAGAKPHIPFPVAGSYPARTGNKVRPLIDGTPAFRRICEAIEAARHSIWVTVAMMVPDFPMPDGRGSIFDVLDRAVARGVDVRVIFWRHDPQSSGYQSFSGTPAEREMLRTRGSRFRARWDRAHEGYCQHQKSWLIDAGQPTETAFVGGINPTRFAVSSPGHTGEGQFHDVYVEVAGPSASDVHHNFVQRWNEASERDAPDGAWGHDGNDALAIPTRASIPRGETLVQIQRTVHAGRYADGRASPGGHPYEIAGGEQTVFAQYIQAIDAARGSIYMRIKRSRFRRWQRGSRQRCGAA